MKYGGGLWAVSLRELLSLHVIYVRIRCYQLLYAFVLCFFISNASFAQTQTLYSTPGTYTFTVPSNVSSVQIEVWSAGGGGSGRHTLEGKNDPGGGGGGGAYSRGTINVVAGETISIIVGAAGVGGGDDASGGNGENSSATHSTASFTVTGGAGGTPANNGGTGGTGGTGNYTGSVTSGTNVTGVPGSNGNGNTGGNGGDGANGGQGGSGSSNASSGSNGAAYGGGGGGASDKKNSVGGSGAAGAVLVSWTIDSDPPACSMPVSPVDNATDFAIDGSLIWDAVNGASGYYIYFGTDASATNIENGTDLGDVTSYTPSSDLNSLTQYYWKVVPYNGNGSATTCSIWEFTTADISSCVPSSNNNDTYISNFSTMGGVDNIANGSGYSSGGYIDNSSEFVSQSEGNAVNWSLTFVAGGNSKAGFAIWVDWNNNGDFTDAGEIMYTTSSTVSEGTYTGSFSVSNGIETGDFKMRILVDYRNATPDPCSFQTGGGGATNGEAEDYTFRVISPCTPPDAPTILARTNPVCSGDDAVFTIKGSEGNIVTYTGVVGVPASPVTIGVGDSIDVTIANVTADVTMNLTNVSDGTCDLDLTGVTQTITVTPLPNVSIVGSSSILIGETTQLSPGSGGTWESNNTTVATVSNDGVVTGVGEGNATFTFISGTAPYCEATTESIGVSNAFDVSVNQPATTCNSANGVLNETNNDVTTTIAFEIAMTTGSTSWSPDWEMKFTLTPANLTNPADVPTINSVESVGGIGDLTVTGNTYTLANIPSSSGAATVSISMNVVGDRYAQLEVDFNITEAKTTISGNTVNDKDSDDWNAALEVSAIPESGQITSGN